MLWLALVFVPAVFGAVPCCTHHKFAATMSRIGAVIDAKGPHIFSEDTKIYYDYDLKMVRADGMTLQGNPYSFVANHNTNMTYTTVGGVCYTNMTADVLGSPCVPSDAVFLGYDILGGPHSTVGVNTWRVMLNDPTMAMTVKMTLTADTCTMVQQSFYGTVHGVPTEYTLFFTDVTEDSYPNGVFNIPAECMHDLGGPVVG